MSFHYRAHHAVDAVRTRRFPPMQTFLKPSFTHTLQDAVGEHTVVTFNVGPAGEVYVLLAVHVLDYRTESNGFASFAKIVPESPQHYRVLVFRQGELELDLPIHGERFNIHLIQPLGDDLLLVCARSRYRRDGDFDLNARVYSRDGRFLREFLLGDGVETIQTTSRGDIWASYFDEGVFGNYGWHTPVGEAGLVAWNEAGEKTYEYDPAGPADAIADCYALNVSGDDDVWCCYYMDFPLVHLHKRRIAATWTVPVAGSHAFAVTHNHVLFAGGYENANALHLVRLGRDGKSTLVGTFSLMGQDGEALALGQAVGRGAVLYVLSGATVHEVDLNAVIAQHGGG